MDHGYVTDEVDIHKKDTTVYMTRFIGFYEKKKLIIKRSIMSNRTDHGDSKLVMSSMNMKLAPH